MKILVLEYRPMPNYEKVLKAIGIDYDLSTEFSDEYDGLLVPGGYDVDPKYYREENEECGKIEADFDEKQFAAINFFIEKKKPIFGICRGHQIINVALGGSLIQDIKSDIEHRRVTDIDEFHAVTNSDGFMKELYGERCITNSSHHQAVKVTGKGLKVISVSDDGIVEAIQHESLPIMAVQFHPERLTLDYLSDERIDGMEIFKYFFEHYFK